MNKSTVFRIPDVTRRKAVLALLGSAVLPGCGGGTDVAGVSSGGTGSFTNGVIVGLGSIIVNGIRYDDSTASVRTESGLSSSAALKLGMVVSIKGSKVTPASAPGGLATATASSIAYDSEWKGAVDKGSPNGNGRGFTLLGQPVSVLNTTVFVDCSLDTLQQTPTKYVEVHGFLDAANGSLQATRVESITAPERYRLSGVVSELSATTFKLGTALIRYSGTSDKPASLKNGLLVRVALKTTRENGEWVATRIVDVNAVQTTWSDADKVELEGTVTAYTSNASFSVNGIPVDASRITVPSGLKLGARVEIKGLVVGGVVQATGIEIEDEQSLENQEYEFHGTISGLDSNAFVIKGYTVRYVVGQTQFELKGKTLADVQAGAVKVQVKARLNPSGQMVAIQIELGD